MKIERSYYKWIHNYEIDNYEKDKKHLQKYRRFPNITGYGFCTIKEAKDFKKLSKKKKESYLDNTKLFKLTIKLEKV